MAGLSFLNSAAWRISVWIRRAGVVLTYSPKNLAQLLELNLALAANIATERSFFRSGNAACGKIREHAKPRFLRI